MALKLTDSDKKTIVELYQHPEESTATLASRYAVSSSTISRILKQALSPTEYQNIVQQKKGGGSKPQSRKSSSKSDLSKSSAPSSKPTKSSSPAKPKLKSSVVSEESAEVVSEESANESKKTKSSPAKSKSVSSRGRKRQRSSAKGKTKTTSQASNAPEDDLEVVQLTTTDIAQDQVPQEIEVVTQQPPEETVDNLSGVEMETESPSDELVHEIQSDLLDEEFDDDIDDDEGDELDDDIDDDEGDDIDAALELPLDGDHLSILPFSEAKLPRTCYIIIDRSAELITRPLKTFADLGTVPDAEINEPTLPIFDNHRIAKRFANRRTPRIVKVPDARVLRKTSPYLMDKGITRLLLDGQVYALIDEDLD